MSLPVFAVRTSISARPFYTKMFEPLVAYAFGSVYLLCARTWAEAVAKAVWKALHLVLLKDNKGLLPLQLWDIQWEKLSANLDQCFVLSDYLQV